MHYIQPLIGAVVILGIGFVFSTNRRAINWNTVAWGLGPDDLAALLGR